MGWLLAGQDLIQKKLAARHLKDDALVLYDLSSNHAYPVDCQSGAKMLNWLHGPTRFPDDASRVSAGIPR